MHKDLLQQEFNLEITFFDEDGESIRRFFKIKQVDKAKKKVKVFMYKEATIRELLKMQDLFDESGTSVSEWLFEFLSINSPRNDKITREEYAQLNSEQINRIFKHILKTHGGGYYRIDEEKSEEAQEAESEDPSRLLSASMVTNILQNTGISVEEFLDMTYRQFKFIQDGVIFNLRAQTKKGQERNKSALLKEASRNNLTSDEAKQSARDLWEKMLAKREAKKQAQLKKSE